MKLLLLSISFTFGLFTSCTPTKESAKRNMEIAKQSSQLPDSLSKKQTAGVDFYASGNSPANWSLDMDFDKNFNFKSADGTMFSTQAVRPSSETKAATIYKSNTQQGAVTIIVYKSTCDDDTSKGNFGKKTEIILNNKQYTGCGKNLYDYRLNDNWVLESADNSVLNATDFSKGLPTIKFNLAKKELTGYDGCNAIFTSIEVEGNRIQFAAIAGTKLNCKNNSIGKIFAEKISNKTADYFFKGEKLYLYLIDDSILIFKKGN